MIGVEVLIIIIDEVMVIVFRIIVFETRLGVIRRVRVWCNKVFNWLFYYFFFWECCYWVW